MNLSETFPRPARCFFERGTIRIPGRAGERPEHSPAEPEVGLWGSAEKSSVSSTVWLLV